MRWKYMVDLGLKQMYPKYSGYTFAFNGVMCSVMEVVEMGDGKNLRIKVSWRPIGIEDYFVMLISTEAWKQIIGYNAGPSYIGFTDT